MSSWNSIHHKQKKPGDAVICSIALNEELYIDEWIKYHLALGFSKIYIYDNSDNNILQSKQTDCVIISHFPGKKRQLEAYDFFVIQYKTKHKWVAIIDIDEFIVLKQHKSIMDFLNMYNYYESIALNWKMFGTAHQIEYSPNPVTERFYLCSNKVNTHVKCITQIEHIKINISSHYPQLKKGSFYDPSRTIVSPPFHNGSYDIACIHHYYTKSVEEFRKKILRGTGDAHPARSLSELDDIHLKIMIL
jgi:hypothetical protein